MCDAQLTHTPRSGNMQRVLKHGQHAYNAYKMTHPATATGQFAKKRTQPISARHLSPMAKLSLQGGTEGLGGLSRAFCRLRSFT